MADGWLDVEGLTKRAHDGREVWDYQSMTVDAAGLRAIATECVNLVAAEFGRNLDWRLDSLETLDEVCEHLLSAGPLNADRRDLWWKLVGAYTGEVVVAAYGGEWITHENAPGSYAVLVDGVTGFPFALAGRVLSGEPLKSLASFGRAFPHIARNAAPGTAPPQPL